jgi:ABC-type glycerol-3-phosphate transport system substrate-binding protein
VKTTVSVLALALALSACGGGASTSTTTPVATTTSTTVVVTTAPEVEQFAFVRAIDESEIRFDPATMLTGEEAVEAAQADGVLAEGETLPNDFYISNPDLEETVAALDPDGAYYLIGFSSYGGELVNRQLSVEELVAVLNGANADSFYSIFPGDVPMNLTLVGDSVVSARQQYLP